MVTERLSTAEWRKKRGAIHVFQCHAIEPNGENVTGQGRKYHPDIHVGMNIEIHIDRSGLCFLHLCDSAIYLQRWKVVELLKTREWARKGRATW